MRGALFALASLLLVRTLVAADLHGVLEHLRRLGGWALLVLVPYGGLLVSETVGWRRLLLLVGVRVRFAQLLAVRACSTGIAACLPAGALAVEGVKPLALERVAGVPKAKTTATLAGCKAMLMSTQSLHFAIVLAFAHAAIARAGVRLGVGGALPWLFASASALLACAALGFVALVTRAEVARRLFAALSALPSERLRAFLAERRGGFLATDRHLAALFGGSRAALVRAATPYLVSWMFEALESFVIFRLLGVPIGFFEVAAIDASVSLLRSLAFVLPSGLGVTDAAYVAMASAFGVAEPATIGAAFIVLKRGKELLWITFGFATLAFVRRALVGSMVAPRPMPRPWASVTTRPSSSS